jgi:hypothetical protein
MINFLIQINDSANQSVLLEDGYIDYHKGLFWFKYLFYYLELLFDPVHYI